MYFLFMKDFMLSYHFCSTIKDNFNILCSDNLIEQL